MALGVGLLVLMFAFVIGIILERKKSKKTFYIVFGITTMLVIAPLLSWLIGIGVGVMVGDGFAGVAMIMLLFPVLFVIGLILLIKGIFKKTKSDQLQEG